MRHGAIIYIGIRGSQPKASAHFTFPLVPADATLKLFPANSTGNLGSFTHLDSEYTQRALTTLTVKRYST
jgi:hypothetical protein